MPIVAHYIAESKHLFFHSGDFPQWLRVLLGKRTKAARGRWYVWAAGGGHLPPHTLRIAPVRHGIRQRMPHRLRATAPGACLYGMRAHSTFGHGRAGCAPHAERLFCCKAEGVDALCSVVHPALPCPPVVASTAFPYRQAPGAAAHSRRGMRRRIPWRTGAILRVWGGGWQRIVFESHVPI